MSVFSNMANVGQISRSMHLPTFSGWSTHSLCATRAPRSWEMMSNLLKPREDITAMQSRAMTDLEYGLCGPPADEADEGGLEDFP